MPSAYAGISLATTRALALNGWAAGIVIACGLMPFAPPTAQLGAAGRALGIGIPALSLAGWTALRLRPQAVTFGALLAVTWLLPALYAPDRDALTEMLTELAVWAFVIGSLSVLMERIRGLARRAGEHDGELVPAPAEHLVGRARVLGHAAAVLERLEVAVAERVRDPDGAAVRITFGWACSEGVSDCDLRTLTERADAALLRRKPARSR